MIQFDLEAFKKRWRVLAEKYGVDPIEGPTIYQVCNIRAERILAQRSRQIWWRDPDMWTHPGHTRNEMEYEIVFHLFAQAWSSMMNTARVALAQDVGNGKGKVLRPLREIHAERGEKLEFSEN